MVTKFNVINFVLSLIKLEKNLFSAPSITAENDETFSYTSTGFSNQTPEQTLYPTSR